MHPIKIKNTVRYLFALPVLTLLTATPLRAQADEVSDLMRARINAQIQESMEQLQLSEEQQEVVRPILEENFTKRLAVMAKYGLDPQSMMEGDRPGRRTLRRMRNDIDEVSKNTEEQLKTVLTDEQIDLWNEMEEERRSRMREQMRN
jgi:hypothetical protein